MGEPILELINISKRYGSTVANDKVSLKLALGEIHAIVGENGAGKSTLMSIIYGLTQPDSGSLRWASTELTINTPLDARKLGIGLVMQHFSVFESMTVIENLYLYASLLRKCSMQELAIEAGEIAQTFGLKLDFEARVADLSVGEKQRVEILKCLLQSNLKLLILDEPTAVLSNSEADSLMESLKGLAKGGCSILYISHKLREVTEIAHSVSILRKGKLLESFIAREVSETQLAELMMGHSAGAELRSGLIGLAPKSVPESLVGQNQENAPAVLSLNSVSLQNPAFKNDVGSAISSRAMLTEVSMSVGAGEILGIAGVAGNGQNALLDVISGEARVSSGCIKFVDFDVTQKTLSWRYTHGLSVIAAERKERSVSINQSLAENYYLKARLRQHAWPINWSLMRNKTSDIISEYNVVCEDEGELACNLSGGNLQKFIIGRELSFSPKCVVCHQPTWGVDIHSARFIRERMKILARSGAAVIIVSEDLDELFDLCDSLAVLHDGRLSEIRAISKWTAAQVGEYMLGLHAMSTFENEGSAA